MSVLFMCILCIETTTVHQKDLHYGKWRFSVYLHILFGFLFVACGCGYCFQLVNNMSGRISDIKQQCLFPSCGCDVTMPISRSNPKHSGKPSWDVVHELNSGCESVYVFERQSMDSSAKVARQLSGLRQLDVGSCITHLQLFSFLCLELTLSYFKRAIFNTCAACNLSPKVHL